MGDGSYYGLTTIFGWTISIKIRERTLTCLWEREKICSYRHAYRMAVETTVWQIPCIPA